jgi:Iron dependent repressor, N-terminal DNA binding domain
VARPFLHAPHDDRSGADRPRTAGTGLRRTGLPFSPAVEDYAKTLYRLEQLTDGPVATGAIAMRLDVSTPSASNMLRHLSELGLVTAIIVGLNVVLIALVVVG